ncbi:MAG TPA: serine/threonine-protein kinase [Pseudonocardiaceae bacterium]|nr:serine/threonine-protein kinase [Pseudonocardiaceae bacterium]
MIEGKQIVGGLAQLIGSLLSWIHQATPNICPGSWPWTVSLTGALLAISPLIGAVAVALLRKGTGNNYGVGMLATLGGFGLFFGFVVPWLFAELVFQSINTARVGGSGVSLSGLSNNICVFSAFGTQGQYLTGGQIGYQALTSTSGNTIEFIVYLVVLGAVPLLCLLAVIMQQRIALRRGPRWPGRLMWLPFLACILFTLLFPANLMAQLWLGFLPASLLGIVVVMLLGQPSWSVIQQAKREAPPPPPPQPQPYESPAQPYVPAPDPYPPGAMPPPPRQLPPTRIGPVPGVPLAMPNSPFGLPTPPPAPPAGQLADTPGPLPFRTGEATVIRWNSAGGRFKRIRQLGHGGFGTVWLAMDTQLNRTVALKLAHAPEADTQARMLREARALAAVHHPNCVRVYDIIEESDGLGIVMEYIDGQPLSEIVGGGNGPLDDIAAARLWATMAGALADAHLKRVLHRDVKPANILLDNTGIAHLIDFGIAKTKGDVTLTAAGMMMGTPDFLAPETAETGLSTPASDAWQLAATVSYALTGQPPRGHRANPMSALMAAAQRLPNTHLPDRSVHRGLLLAALDADPARRPTLTTVQRQLGDWLSGAGHRQDGPVTVIVPKAEASTRRIQ